MTTSNCIPELRPVTDFTIDDPSYDGYLIVSGTAPGEIEPEPFKSLLARRHDICKKRGTTEIFIGLAGKKLFYSSTGPLDNTGLKYCHKAAEDGMNKILAAGIKKPLLILLPNSVSHNIELIVLLGCLRSLYNSLESRENSHEFIWSVDYLGVYHPIPEKLERTLKLAHALESGRIAARDIGGSDPEKMSLPNLVKYVKDLFSNSMVTVEEVTDPVILKRDFPLFDAVKRGAGQIIRLNYMPCKEEEVQESIFIGGMGICLDLGRHDFDIHDDGITEVSQNKFGVASACGFIKAVECLQPPTTKVVVMLGIVSEGCCPYSCAVNKIIIGKAGKKIRVVDTNMKGRYILADILWAMKNEAAVSVNPSLISISSRIGQADVEKGYSVIIDNLEADKLKVGKNLSACGMFMADPAVVDQFILEDFESLEDHIEGDDSYFHKYPKTKYKEGTKNDAAFIITAAELDDEIECTKSLVKFTHIDVTGSTNILHEPVNAPMVCALIRHFFRQWFENDDVTSAMDII